MNVSPAIQDRRLKFLVNIIFTNDHQIYNLSGTLIMQLDN